MSAPWKFSQVVFLTVLLLTLGRVFHPYDDTSPRSTREEIPSDGACNGPCPTTEGGLRLRSEQAARHPGRETGVSPDFIRATISPLVSHDPLGGLPASTLQARQAPPRQGPPSNVLYFEPLTNVSIKTTADTQQADGRGRLQVSFAAFGKQFDLQLEPNNLFAPDAKNIWIDNETKTVEASTPLFYQGEIAGEPNSWIRISMQDGVMDGMIRSKEETYFVEPGERFLAGPSPTPMVMYRLSDTTSDWKPGSCALDHPTVASAMGHHALATEPISDYDAVRAELRALAGSTLEQIDLGIVADYEYFLKYGPSAATTMQNIINQVDGIFRSELGVSLRVTTTIVYTTPNDPFSDTTDPEALLDEFDSYKGNSASPIRGTGLAHLFTRRDFAGETVGIAWIGTLCHASRGTGISQDFIDINKSRVILTAHEMGHNFDAPHDNESGSACATTSSDYIMSSSVTPDLNLQFSSCSKSFIAPMVANARCLLTIANTPIELDNPLCTYSLSSYGRLHKAKGAKKKVKVKALTGCPWTAVSNASWVTIMSVGAKAVTYQVAPNPDITPRSGTLSIAGQTFTVDQKGRKP